MREISNQEIFGKLEDALGATIPQEYKEKIEGKLREMRSYVPKVGVFGKTGVGKSSLCNALFGRDICAIGDVEACTRDPQKVILSFGNSGGLELIDVPGVGESSERDKEYDELYQKLLPELDLVFWVFKGDDRAAAVDEKFYKRLIRRYIDAGKPFIAVINQVDKIEPFREWSLEERKPGAKQATNIEAKRHNIAGLFDLPLSQVLAISANERYGLVELVDAIVHALPNDKKAVVLEKIKAAEEAEIAAKQAEAVKAQANVELEKARAETAKIELVKAQQEMEAKAAAEASEVEKLKLIHAFEIQKMKLKAEEEEAIRKAEERARIAEQEAKERERERNVSRRAEKEAEKGFIDTIINVITSSALGSWVGSKTGWW